LEDLDSITKSPELLSRSIDISDLCHNLRRTRHLDGADCSDQSFLERLMEHHRGQRHATDVTVQFFTRPDAIGIGRVLNVSATGAFMETRLPLRPLALLYLEPTIRLPDGSSERIAATVVRCTPTGVGLEWCEFAAEATRAYARLAAASTDLADEHQLPLPAMPDAPPFPGRLSRSFELPGLCRVEFLE
jgi:hypothetical protein